MQRVSRIVCPIDLSQGAGNAVVQAATLARLHDAELHLLYVPGDGDHRPSWQGDDASRGGLGALAAAGLWGPGGADPEVEVRLKLATERGRPAKAIANYARRHRADLIVVNAHYGASRRWRRAAWVARTLARSASCPVMVIPRGAPAPSGASRAPFADILCAIDFTAASVAALRAAIPLVQGRHGRLTLLHVLEEVPGHMVFSGGEAAQAVRDYEARVAADTQRLRRLAPLRALNTWQVKPIVVSGPPYRGISRAAADAKADLIVMGMTRRGVLAELFAESTSHAVLRHATCPVLLVAGDEERREREVAGDERAAFLRRKAA